MERVEQEFLYKPTHISVITRQNEIEEAGHLNIGIPSFCQWNHQHDPNDSSNLRDTDWVGIGNQEASLNGPNCVS